VKGEPAVTLVQPTFFTTPGEFREWLEANHEGATMLWVGFHRRATGRPSLTWPESVDQALCYGWIDGLRKGLDAASYAIRFSPRKPGSYWSAVNTKRAHELVALGLMRPAGLAAFAARDEARTRQYSFEREAAALDQEQEQHFRAQPAAWEFFQAQPPSYRKPALLWVVSARREETRRKRLEALIADSAAGRRISMLKPPRTT